MIKPFTYKYIPRSVQLDSIVRVKKLNKVQGLSTYQLLINGVHWKYCVSNGKVHYHDVSVDNAAKNLRLHLDCDKKWFSR